MNEIVVFLMVLFTAQGPGVTTLPLTDPELCVQMVDNSEKLIGQKVKGPTGEEVVVTDVQAKCLPFKQNKRA